MTGSPKRPARDDASLYGDHASGRYGDQAYGRVDAPGSPASASHDSTNAQVTGGAPATGVEGADDELSSPGISTDKKSDDTKPEAAPTAASPR
jgi:hypothetical protein